MMEDLHSINNSHCGELERLAAAAASMDYTDSLSPTQAHNSKDQDSQPSVPSTQSEIQIAHSSRSITNNDSQAISYIDQYHVPKGHQLVPLRSYEPSQHYIHEHPQAIQSFPGSRIVMVAGNNPITNIHFTRTASQYIVNDTGHSYQAENSENCVQPVSYSQLLAHSNTEIMNYDSPNAESEEVNQDAISVIQSNTEKEERVSVVKKKGSKRKENIKASAKRKETTKELNNSNNDDSGSFPCTQCKAIFESETALKLHQSELHNMPKRNGLALELKIEIIKRINAGEKKADMADEYGVNSSTIKSIMKKADSYLTCWKKGLFNPDSKRLKGPKREDVEEALYSWYKQAIDNDAPVSGPILCAKAQDFAKKLGHTDFKPTHGWLDRFKKRKKIVFGRSSSKRRREDKIQEPLTSLLPQMLIDYESHDIFAVELLGLCYGALPSQIETLKGIRCAGGVKSKERLSVVLCANMTGSEKFPLLVAGRSQKNFALKNSKTMPIHFIVDKYAWLTADTMSSWLLDMDSWFVQQGRKVIILVPPSPLFSHLPKLRAVKFVTLPSGYPSPLRQVAVPCFKRYYRKKFLEEVLIQASRGKSSFTQLSILTCLQLLSSAWQSLTENVIVSSFQRAGLTKYCVWGMIVPTDNSDLAGAQETFLSAVHILNNPPPPEITFDDFVHFDDDLQVCNLMGDDDILAKVKGIPEEDEFSDEENGVSIQEKFDTERPSFSDVEKALGVIRRYIQYQEGAQEMFRVLGHLEYYIYNNVSEELVSNQGVH